MAKQIVKCCVCGKEMGFNQAYKCHECDGLVCQDHICAGTCDLCIEDGYMRPESESKEAKSKTGSAFNL